MADVKITPSNIAEYRSLESAAATVAATLANGTASRAAVESYNTQAAAFNRTYNASTYQPPAPAGSLNPILWGPRR